MVVGRGSASKGLCLDFFVSYSIVEFKRFRGFVIVECAIIGISSFPLEHLESDFSFS